MPDIRTPKEEVDLTLVRGITAGSLIVAVFVLLVWFLRAVGVV